MPIQDSSDTKFLANLVHLKDIIFPFIEKSTT